MTDQQLDQAQRDGCSIAPDGTVTDRLGNFVGIDQPAAAELFVVRDPEAWAEVARAGHSVKA